MQAPGTRLTRYHRAPRDWLALLAVDVSGWTVGLVGAAWARYEFDLNQAVLREVLFAAMAALYLHALIGHLTFLYRGRHPLGSIEEARAVAWTVMLTAGSLLVVDLVRTPRALPASVAPVGGALALLVMVAMRCELRRRRERRLRPDRRAATPVLLFGLGAAGHSLLRAMLRDPDGRYLPVGLLDDDPAKGHLRVDGVRVLGGRVDVPAAVASTGAETVILSVANAHARLIREIREIAIGAGAAFKVLPSVSELLDQRVRVADVRDVDTADLLGRRQIQADVRPAAAYLTGRRVLVTGAGGSIGSELCRQIFHLDAELLMLDRDESALHAVQLALYGRAMLDRPDVILADVRDTHAIAAIVAARRPDVVFHAAALKHLPLLQSYPAEALKTNVWGTLAVLEACRHVEKFVNISTDKAANPISVLGYSKRITERLTAHAAAVGPGTFLSVRFGNVLGSRGSVLTTFQAQVAAGGPITVTHPDVTRYFMTVQEAVHLVIQAGAIGQGGEALVLDMGKPVRISDVAARLASEAQVPVEIVYTGLRPGEKLHEELFGAGEQERRSSHPMVSHVVVPPLHPDEVRYLDAYTDQKDVMAQLIGVCGIRSARELEMHPV